MPLTRPRVGFRPTRLCAWLGQMIDPSVSVPTVTVAKPEGGGRPGAAARPARRQADVVRVQHLTTQRRVAARHVLRHEVRHLGEVGLAEDHRAGLAQPGHQVGVAAGHRVLQGQRAAGRRQAGHVDVVLHQDRYAVQRAAYPPVPALGVHLLRHVGRVGCETADRVHRRAALVERVDAGEVAGHEVGAGGGAAAHGLGHLGDARGLEVQVGHGKHVRGRRQRTASRHRRSSEGGRTPRATGRRSRWSPRWLADVELLLLDEPTSGLDPLMESVFQECIDEFRDEGRSVLLSSHILAEVERLCDRVSIIRAGRTVETGTLAELRHLTRTSVTAELATAPTGLDQLVGVHDLVVEGDRAVFEVDTEQLGAALDVLGRFGDPHPDQPAADPGGVVPAALRRPARRAAGAMTAWRHVAAAAVPPAPGPVDAAVVDPGRRSSSTGRRRSSVRGSTRRRRSSTVPRRTWPATPRSSRWPGRRAHSTRSAVRWPGRRRRSARSWPAC